MPQLLSRDTPGSVVTVAELVRRCAPEPRPDDAAESADDGASEATAMISVEALLRREGRTDLAPDRPLVIGGWTGPARGLLVRRGAIAAGALLAAGTVFGLTAVVNAAGHDATSRQPVENGSYSDEGTIETADPTVPTADAGAEPTADPFAVSTATATAFPTAAPAVSSVALAGSEIARHAIVPAARPTPAAAPAPAAPAVTSSALPTSSPEHADEDDVPRGTSTPDKHHDSGPDPEDGADRSTAPTSTKPPKPTKPPMTEQATATTTAAAPTSAAATSTTTSTTTSAPTPD